ncbi:hypothetical protein AVEN_205116-1 [Araneus ventricosus]|uniref:Uncharacterized protein n=1 Tax=Araneus ventricosus TaxID=182803 RepID=A0A4Y2J8W5_ARAVE|nr:hypothetical protein AVEN_205116-1 [Araneus ventricosus]
MEKTRIFVEIYCKNRGSNVACSFDLIPQNRLSSISSNRILNVIRNFGFGQSFVHDINFANRDVAFLYRTSGPSTAERCSSFIDAMFCQKEKLRETKTLVDNFILKKMRTMNTLTVWDVCILVRSLLSAFIGSLVKLAVIVADQTQPN